MDRAVEIAFDCRPFRSVGRLDVPLDAPAEVHDLCHRFRTAIARHGTANTYYLYNASCTFHLTNGPGGVLRFEFEGTLWTDPADRHATRSDLAVTLRQTDCGPLAGAVREFFERAVERAVRAEFDAFIAAGELERLIRKAEADRLECERLGGFIGMNI